MNYNNFKETLCMVHIHMFLSHKQKKNCDFSHSPQKATIS